MQIATMMFVPMEYTKGYPMVYVLFLAAIQTKGDTSVYTTTVKSKQQKYGSLVY
jgi:hypothetical protein